MSKFTLRNLENEKRRLEKEILKIEKRIHRIKNTKVIAEGTINVGTKIRFKTVNSLPSDDKVATDVALDIKYEVYKNEITCTLVLDDVLLGRETFIGKTRCAEDDEFDMATGMCIAECRAVQKVYEYMSNIVG